MDPPLKQRSSQQTSTTFNIAAPLTLLNGSETQETTNIKHTDGLQLAAGASDEEHKRTGHFSHSTLICKKENMKTILIKS